jgi:hypothetical protein
MWTPEVQGIFQREKYDSAVIVGIEVRFTPRCFSTSLSVI